MCVIIADDLNTVLDISVIETQYPPLCRLSLNEYKNHLWPPNARFYINVGVVAQTEHCINSESANS